MDVFSLHVVVGFAHNLCICDAGELPILSKLVVPLQCKLVCKSLLRHVSITMNKEGFSLLSINSGYTVMGCDVLLLESSVSHISEYTVI